MVGAGAVDFVIPDVYQRPDQPEVTELPLDEGWDQWFLAKALQDAAQPKEQS